MAKRRKTAIHRTAGLAGIDISLQDVMDGIEDRLLVIDSEYRVRFANLAMRYEFHEGAESPIGRRCYEVLHNRDKPCSSPLWECPLRKVLESGSLTRIVHPDLSIGADSTLDRNIKITMWPLKDSHGEMDAIVEVRRDVTAETEVEKEALKRHDNLDALSRISSAVSGLWDLDAILNVALDIVLQVFSSSIGGILLFDERVQKLCYKAHRGLSAEYVGEMCLTMGDGVAGRVAQTGEPVLLEDISKDPYATRPDLIKAEGLKAFVSVPLKAKERVVGVMNVASYSPGQFGSGDMYLLNSIGCQLGIAVEQAELYERLNAARERYQMLLRQAVTIQEQERRRVARELHDETSQDLTALALNLQAVSEMMEMGNVENVEIKATLKRAHTIAVHASAEVARLIRELRPTLLDTLGLAAAVHNLAETNLGSQGINVSTEFEGMDQRLPAETELALFRIAQEAISNIVRHSEARNASVRLECNDSECVLRVEDNGKGFDVSEITSIDAGGRGAGMFGMKERVTMVGGTCSCQSQPGQGARVIARVPITRSGADGEDKGTGSG
jgi:signal transduction histidine kinase